MRIYKINKDVFINHEEYKVPPFSTIERSARDIKLKYPNLRGKASNQQKRKQSEEEYKKYYVGGKK